MIDKNALAESDNLSRLVEALEAAKNATAEKSEVTTVRLAGKDVNVTKLEEALTVLKKGQWKSIKPALKSVDSPLLDLPYQELADKKKKIVKLSTGESVSSKVAFITFVEETAKSQGFVSPLFDEPVETELSSEEPSVEAFVLPSQKENLQPASKKAGAMIALKLAPDSAKAVAIEGEESLEELHLTLCFLTKDAAEIPEEDQEAIKTRVAEVATFFPPFSAEVFSVNYLNPHGSSPAVVLGIRGVDRLLNLKENLGSIPRSVEYKPWLPHVTLSYTRDWERVIAAALPSVGQNIVFRSIQVVFGDVTYDVPLTGTDNIPDEDSQDED